MKKLLSVLLLLCLCMPVALAGLSDDPNHFAESVVDGTYESVYPEFYNAASPSIIIPGLSMDFIPQGIAYYEPGNLMFLTGYSSFGFFNSMLLAVDMTTNQVVKEVLLCMPDGEPYTGHAGGVCVTGRNIYISGESCLYRLPLSDFHAAAPMDVLGFAEVIPVPVKASFCQIDNGVLWVGEFYEGKNPKNHTSDTHFKTVDGGMNHSWLLGYKLDGGTANELSASAMTAQGAAPDYVLSIPDRIQGVTICNGEFYLSQSYGRTNPSTIYRHENVMQQTTFEQAWVCGQSRPMWVLDNSSQDAALTCPPMTEGLCTIGGQIYVSFESAANYYRIPEDDKGPSLHPVDRVYKIDPSKF